MQRRSIEFTLAGVEYTATAEYDDQLEAWTVAEITGLSIAGEVARHHAEIVADDAITALQDAVNKIVGQYLRGELSAR